MLSLIPQQTAASFFSGKSDSSDENHLSNSGEDRPLSDFVRCDTEKMHVPPQLNSIAPQQNQHYSLTNAKRTAEPPNNANEIKGFTIDGDTNRYHCLDCGKNFKQKYSYNQHQRL